MKNPQRLWMKHLVAGAAAIALPLTAMAHGLMGDTPETCPPMRHAGSPMAPPPHGMFPGTPAPGVMPASPYLRGLELTEAQQDNLFALTHEQAPNERKQLKTAFKAMEELRRLASSDAFDADKARVFAETHALALAKVALMHAEFDARVRALLTLEQRKLLDDARTRDEPRRTIKGMRHEK